MKRRKYSSFKNIITYLKQFTCTSQSWILMLIFYASTIFILLLYYININLKYHSAFNPDFSVSSNFTNFKHSTDFPLSSNYTNFKDSTFINSSYIPIIPLNLGIPPLSYIQNIPYSASTLKSHPYFSSSSCHIVYFFISDNIIDYLPITIGQLRCWSKTCDIILLISFKAIEQVKNNPDTYTWLHDYRVILIDINPFFNKSENIREALKQKKYLFSFFPQEPRPEMWFNAFIRSFYLEIYMRDFELTDILHIEGDTIWYTDPAELIPIFRKIYPAIASPRINEDNIVLGPLWVRSFKNLQHMNRYFLDKFKLYPNKKKMLDNWILNRRIFKKSYLGIVQEMELTAKYANEMGYNYYSTMPSDPFVYNNHSVKTFSNGYGVIFDAARFGTHICGAFNIDPGFLCPRDSQYCCQKFIDKKYCRRFEYAHFAILEKDLDISWGKDELGRNIPYLDVYKWSHPLPYYPPLPDNRNNELHRWPLKYRLLNVHWHSKNYFYGFCSLHCTEKCNAFYKDMNNSFPLSVKSPLFPLVSPESFPPPFIFSSSLNTQIT